MILKENSYLSLNGHCNIKTAAISGNIYVYEKEKEWKNSEKMSLSFIPYGKICCSVNVYRDDGYFEEFGINLSYRFKKHRFEAALRREICLSKDFPSLKYEYEKGAWQFSLLNSGENLNQLFCAIAYYLDSKGRFSQTFQYDKELEKYSLNSKYNGAIIGFNNGGNIQITPSGESFLNSGKIIVHLFLDKNYNGVFENTIDQHLNGVRINIDGSPSQFQTSNKGTALLKISFPRKAYIGADIETLPIQATPDNPVPVNITYPATIKVEIPIYLTGEILGTDNGNSIKIQLARKKTGKVVAESDVLTDGTFYFSKIIPGDYILIAGNRKKEVTIKIDKQGEPISILDIIFEK